MSLSTTTNRSDRTLNGVATVFAFDFKVFAETDLEVIHIDQTTEVETVLTLGVDYTVSGVNADAGSVTLVAGPGTSGDRLIIKRVMNLVQPTRLRNQGDFFPATHERAFDRSIMIDQQQQEEIDRCFKLDPGAEPPFDNLLDPRDFIVGMTWYHQVENFTATEGQTVFTLATAYVPNVNALAVYRNGVRLIHGSDFTETDEVTVTLLDPCVAGDVVSTTTAQGVNDATGVAAAEAVRADYIAADAVVAADAAALKTDLADNGYILNFAGAPDMGLVPTGLSGSAAIKSQLPNTASRLYIIPNGNPGSGATGTLKIFGTDYGPAITDYRDLGFYYDIATAEFRINSKSNGSYTPAPVYFTSMDAAYIAGGFYTNGNYAGMVMGGRLPAGVTFFASVPTLFTASAAFLNNTLLRWYTAAGTGVGHGMRFNASDQFELLNNGVVAVRVASSYTQITGAFVTDLVTGTAGDTTPSVIGKSFLQIPTNGSTYNITDFTVGTTGQRLTILFSDNKPTLVNSSGLRLAGGVNFTGSAGSTISFIRGPAGWFETSRSVN